MLDSLQRKSRPSTGLVRVEIKRDEYERRKKILLRDGFINAISRSRHSSWIGDPSTIERNALPNSKKVEVGLQEQPSK